MKLPIYQAKGTLWIHRCVGSKFSLPIPADAQEEDEEADEEVCELRGWRDYEDSGTTAPRHLLHRLYPCGVMQSHTVDDQISSPHQWQQQRCKQVCDVNIKHLYNVKMGGSVSLYKKEMNEKAISQWDVKDILGGK